MNLPLDAGAEMRILAWLDTLASWNAKLDLTAARSPEELVDLMVADALVLAQHVAPSATVIDIGTGAGAPGFALACLRPDIHAHLVDPLAKRISFLRVAGAEAGVSNLTLHLGALEKVEASLPRGAEVMARATFAPPIWFERAKAELKQPAKIWIFLAKEPIPSGFDAALELDYCWPMTDVARKLVATSGASD